MSGARMLSRGAKNSYASLTPFKFFQVIFRTEDFHVKRLVFVSHFLVYRSPLFQIFLRASLPLSQRVRSTMACTASTPLRLWRWDTTDTKYFLFIIITQNEIRASVYRKRRQLKQAFDVLKVWCNEKWVITQKRWLTLMKEVCPQWSPARVALLWQVLDDNSDGKIGKSGCSTILTSKTYTFEGRKMHWKFSFTEILRPSSLHVNCVNKKKRLFTIVNRGKWLHCDYVIHA